MAKSKLILALLLLPSVLMAEPVRTERSEQSYILVLSASTNTATAPWTFTGPITFYSSVTAFTTFTVNGELSASSFTSSNGTSGRGYYIKDAAGNSIPVVQMTGGNTLQIGIMNDTFNINIGTNSQSGIGISHNFQSGNVTINGTNNTHRLRVNGDSLFTDTMTLSNAKAFYSQTAGGSPTGIAILNVTGGNVVQLGDQTNSYVMKIGADADISTGGLWTLNGTQRTHRLRVNGGVYGDTATFTSLSFISGSTVTQSFSSVPLVGPFNGETGTLAAGSTFYVSPPLPSAIQLFSMTVFTKVAGSVASASDTYKCGDTSANTITVNVPSASAYNTITTSTTTINIPATNRVYCWYDSTAAPTTPQASVSTIGVIR